MKVVVINRISPPYYSGAGRVTFQIARNLRRKGVGVTMLTSRFDRNVSSYEVIEDVEVFRFPVPASHRLAQILFYLQCAYWLLCHPDTCDLIQFATMPRYCLPVQAAAWLLHKRVFLRMSLFGSDDLASISRSRRCILRMAAYKRADGILAITHKLADTSKRYLRNPSIIQYIPNPVDIDVFYPATNSKDKCKLREEKGAGIGEKIVVFVGIVGFERKGIDLLVAAWPAVIQAFPQARLYVIGPRFLKNGFGNKYTNIDFLTRIDKRIQEFDIGESIIFIDHQQHGVADYLRMATLFILPSRQEGLANAVLEAMACGLPCIVCKQPWLPDDLIRHGETGLISEPTPESIAENIISILRNQPMAEQMGIEARKVAEREYNPDTLTRRLIEFYSSSLG